MAQYVMTQEQDGRTRMLPSRISSHLHDLGLFDNALALLIFFPLLYRVFLQTVTEARLTACILAALRRFHAGTLQTHCLRTQAEQRAHVFPAEHGVAGGAVDVGHSVQAGDEQSILLGAPCHIDAAEQDTAWCVTGWRSVSLASPACFTTS